MIRQPYTDVPNDKPNKLFPDRLRWEPMLLMRLCHKHAQTPRFRAYVDSGSPYCLFKLELADYIGLDAKKNPVFTDDLSGIVEGPRDTIYFQNVTIQLEIGHRIGVVAGFAKKLSTEGILGRNGFFENFKLTFDHSGTKPVFEIERINKPI